MSHVCVHEPLRTLLGSFGGIPKVNMDIFSGTGMALT